jgi:hypothetical protein
MPTRSVSRTDQTETLGSAERESTLEVRGHLAGYTPAMAQAMRAPGPDLEGLAAEVATLLENAPVAEALGAKLSRLLYSFLQGDVLPQAERAADLGLDPTPMLAVVSDVLRLYVDALEPRQPIDR